MSEFTEAYAKSGKAERAAARKSLEREIAAQLTAIYGRVWSKGKIAVKAHKMVDETLYSKRAA